MIRICRTRVLGAFLCITYYAGNDDEEYGAKNMTTSLCRGYKESVNNARIKKEKQLIRRERKAPT